MKIPIALGFIKTFCDIETRFNSFFVFQCKESYFFIQFSSKSHIAIIRRLKKIHQFNTYTYVELLLQHFRRLALSVLQ